MTTIYILLAVIIFLILCLFGWSISVSNSIMEVNLSSDEIKRDLKKIKKQINVD